MADEINLLSTTRDEFFTLLLIYASYADLEFSSVEKEYIVNKFGEATFDKMNLIYDSFSEFQLLSYISANRLQYMDSLGNDEQLSDELTTLFNIDGEFSRLEKGFYNFIKRILNEGL
jgi:hypothetical protein